LYRPRRELSRKSFVVTSGKSTDMPISWNEIRHRAINFSKEWQHESREQAEAKSFWDEFFNVFGLRRRVVASFEEPVKSLQGTYGFIDLFWKAVLLAEHKSRGKSLERAHSQAMLYIQDLQNEGREAEVPRYILVSDFARIALHDLEEGTSQTFELGDLHQHIHQFAFIPGYKQHRFEDQDPINIKAVRIMGDLHDALEAGGYSGHALERFLVRVLFCLFSEDTGIFDRNAFTHYIENRTVADGSDLGVHLARLFEVLNTQKEQRQKNLDELLAELPYVNGEMFAEHLGFAEFNADMRNSLLACTRFDWAQISPAIFGSLFQAIMEPKQRRQIGGHYTSERDILKVIRSLFLDDLRAEFKRAKQKSKAELQRFHKRLGQLRFLDPACGCGNFLVVTYRELRLLEIEVLKALNPNGQRVLDIQHVACVDVDAMYGIEIHEWPVRIAEAAMWLMDHQMNLRLSETFGQYYVRLPLTKSPTIVHGNALRLDWKKILPPQQGSFVLGNPPFVGKKARNTEQKHDMRLIFGDAKGVHTLDYVACWYVRAAKYIDGTDIRVGFVSTNSITQGEQPGILWRKLAESHITIAFAHRTFAWESEARGKAHVHVVIVGFSQCVVPNGKQLFDYSAITGEATACVARNINPYLIDSTDVVLQSRSHPLCAVSEIQFGNMPNDDGNLILSDEEKRRLCRDEPQARRFVRPFLTAKEYLHRIRRWCLWLQDASPEEIRNLPEIQRRVQAVRDYRKASPRATTRDLAAVPTRFGEIRQPESKFVLIPRHSSENRDYIPISFFTPKCIVGDSCLFIQNASLFEFGVLTSAMHMAWVKTVCGRIKSDFRYSGKLVYNNFPWPEQPTEKQRATVAAAAQSVLDARADYPDSTLDDLYDPLVTPVKLVKAHRALNLAVDRCYRKQPFTSDRQRVEILFALYEKLTSPLIEPSRPARKTRQPK
jgi:type I restriction-modification system DNA methylase subunit